MMKIITFLFLFIFISNGMAQTTMRDAKVIALMQSTIWRNTIQSDSTPVSLMKTPNAVLLIKDKATINQLSELAGNELLGQNYGPKSSFHWDLLFLHPKSKLSVLSFDQINKNNLKYNKLIDYLTTNYLDSLKNYPANFLYQVEISSSISPEQAISLANEKGFNLYSFNWKSNLGRPYILVRYNVVVRPTNGNSEIDYRSIVETIKSKKMEALKSSLNKKYPVSFTDKSYNSYSPQKSTSNLNYEYSDEQSEYIYFEYGTDLKGIETIIYENGMKLEKMYDPDSYILQLIHSSTNLDSLKKEILYTFPFTLDLFIE